MNIEDIEMEIDNMKTKRSKRIGKKSLVLGVVFTLAFSMFAGAAIVDYLSNEVTDTVSVESPFKIKVKNHPEGEWNNIITDDGFFVAGSTGKFWAKAINQANNDLDGTIRIKLTDWNGINGNEITYLFADVESDGLPGQEIDVSNLYTSDTNGESGWDHLILDIPFTDFPAGATEEGSLTFTLSPYATGDYTISVQIV